MKQIGMELKQTWDTIDEAVKYFATLSEDLRSFKAFKEEPTDLYVHVEKETDGGFMLELTNL